MFGSPVYRKAIFLLENSVEVLTGGKLRYIYMNIDRQNFLLCDERLGAKLRVTENRSVLFNSLTYVCLALLPQH